MNGQEGLISRCTGSSLGVLALESGDLCVPITPNDAPCVLTDNKTFDIPAGSPFLQLNGQKVVDMEIFKVVQTETAWFSAPVVNKQPKNRQANTSPIDLPASAATVTPSESYDDDVLSFGVSVADYLLVERIAQHEGHDELGQANAKVAAAASALVALYDEDIAANKEGASAVVELSVRGTRMTTLRSTLLACPDSAFAARFDENKWTPTEKDVDADGRRVIDDCSPSVFSKILDVLRVRKRKAWACSGDGDDGSDVRVVVEAADREAFEEFVHMYFTDRESFITDLVQTP
ncbi:unnamed protein product [Hapterophycus canaliculatus]